MLKDVCICQRGAKILRLIINVMVTMVFMIVSIYAVKNPVFPKTTAYSFVREAAKKEMEIRTRNWESLTNKYFIVKYHQKDAGIADLVLNTIIEDYQSVNDLLKFDNKRTVPIVIYPDNASLVKSFGWDADESALGVYWAGVIRVLSPFEWLDENMSQEEMLIRFRESGPMVHEYVHLVVDYRTKGNYTRWFTEGIAQLIERDITGFEFDYPAKKGEWYPLKDMDRGFDKLPSQSNAYRQSLVMVEKLVNEYGYEGLNKILDYLGEGKTMKQAFWLGTGITLKNFEEICRSSQSF
ncbi:MAG: hypothetical protein AB1420_09810 [Bacillota bacterium]